MDPRAQGDQGLNLADTRSAGLSESAAGDASLAEVDALLASAAREVDRGLAEGASRIGRYTLVTPVGQGGFGTVWMASQDEPIRRLVAVKVLRREPGSSMVLARFENERQALALMDHPNVATVLDAGMTEDGRPWFAMPYIDGLPVTQACDERRLTVRERVEIFIAACAGVQHAHQKGVIHRDIKPANILVTRVGVPPIAKVIDFGVAKALDSARDAAMRTADGQRLGTPQYMAPEQWLHGAALADARSDVYALGAVLGELLVGGPLARLPRTPLEVPAIPRPSDWLASRDPAERRAIARARESDPDALLDRVRGDLDAIVLRATAADPEHRYPSAAALGDDLRRWLDGRPVSARMLEPWERLVRTVRRQPLAAAMVAVSVVAVVAGLMLWWSGWSEARRQQANATSVQQTSEVTFELASSVIADMVQKQRWKGDSPESRESIARVERLVERIAQNDPLASARLVALTAHGLLGTWERGRAYELVRRSVSRVLAADPRGSSAAFQELLPEYVTLGLALDRPDALAFAPGLLARLAEDGSLAAPASRDLVRALMWEHAPWPFLARGPDGDAGLASAQLYAGLFPDPVEAGCVHAGFRLRALARMDGRPNRFEETIAARAYLREHFPPDHEEVLIAESQTDILMAIDGIHSDDLVEALLFDAMRLEHAYGSGAPSTANAYWNLCHVCAALGLHQDAYESYARLLWPTYRRQSPKNELRRWYLAYFAPVAFRACDYETAYAAAMTQLADTASTGAMRRDGVESLSAETLAGVLALWGDEQGAGEVEAAFGVSRMRP